MFSLLQQFICVFFCPEFVDYFTTFSSNDFSLFDTTVEMCFPVNIIDNIIQEDVEMFMFNIFPDSENPINVIFPQTSVNITILDDGKYK